MTREQTKKIVREMQKLWQLYEETQNVSYCHALSARAALLHWEWNTGAEPARTTARRRPKDIK